MVVQDAVPIARETADIILLKKSLLVIVSGVEEGRKIFINTLKYISITVVTTSAMDFHSQPHHYSWIICLCCHSNY